MMAASKLWLVCWLCVYVQAQDAVFRTTSNLQSVAVQVTDAQGNYIPGLSAKDFTLLEDGKPQKIAFFGAEKLPVSLAILIDSSSSMQNGDKLTRARALLGPLIRGNLPEDEIFVMPFTDRLGPFRQLTAEQRSQPVPPAIGSAGGGTALYDALASSLCHMRTAQNLRQAVIVITDGADQHSRLRLEQLIGLAQSSNAQIFMIGFYEKSEYEIYREGQKTVTLVGGTQIDNPVVVFDRLARESGAESFFPNSERDLQKALERISAILRAQYTLAYYPQDVGKFRKIQVKVSGRGTKVMTRRGVGSEAGDEPVHFASTSCEVSPSEHLYPWERHVTLSEAKTRIYKEDFSDLHSGWPNHIERPPDQPVTMRRGQTIAAPVLLPTSHYVKGGYELSRARSSNLQFTGPISDGVVAAYGPSWNDFRATVSLEADWGRTETIVPEVYSASGGMVFHLNGLGYYAVVISGSSHTNLTRDIAFKVFKRFFFANMPTDVIPWTRITFPESPDQPPAKSRRLTVVNRQGRITVMVDDLEVGSGQDSSFPDGLVGLGFFGYGRAIFHDLLVEDLRPGLR
jgi:VWFA-related protein